MGEQRVVDHMQGKKVEIEVIKLGYSDFREFLGFKVLNFYGGFDLKLKNKPPKDWTVVVVAKKVKNT